MKNIRQKKTKQKRELENYKRMTNQPTAYLKSSKMVDKFVAFEDRISEMIKEENV